MYDPTFDPIERITEHGVRIVRRQLAAHDAIWIPHQRAVIVDVRLRPDRLKPVLTHEWVHVVNNDPGGHHPRNEARANLISALILTNPDQWLDLTRIHPDYDHVCLELGITREQFLAFYRHTIRKAA